MKVSRYEGLDGFVSLVIAEIRPESDRYAKKALWGW